MFKLLEGHFIIRNEYPIPWISVLILHVVFSELEGGNDVMFCTYQIKLPKVGLVHCTKKCTKYSTVLLLLLRIQPNSLYMAKGTTAQWPAERPMRDGALEAFLIFPGVQATFTPPVSFLHSRDIILSKYILV